MLVRALCIQLRETCESELKVKVGDRTVTLKMKIGSIRGDYHAQQGWNGLWM